MIALAAVLAAVSAVGFDFASFVRTVTSAPPPATTRADAIVVLTGGAARIPYALDLLKDGRAERMLISGVDPRVSENAVLSRLAPVARFLAGCCIDFGREASNTVGNAAEARKWAEEKGFHSLFVVTSAYHIPRSLAEFGDALPGRTLIPYPVARPGLDLDRWYERPETIRLVISEYLKFTLVRARLLAERLGLASPASVSQAAGVIPHKPGPA
ncbi:YdcF family protein [Segnochrobactrum spirostomi]|nr:YdcF family protein [Segnochrobactrum spirostomi]